MKILEKFIEFRANRIKALMLESIKFEYGLGEIGKTSKPIYTYAITKKDEPNYVSYAPIRISIKDIVYTYIEIDYKELDKIYPSYIEDDICMQNNDDFYNFIGALRDKYKEEAEKLFNTLLICGTCLLPIVIPITIKILEFVSTII